MMPLELILVRHAKSSWSTARPDHERPLNERGRKSAVAIGNWLREHGHVPDQVLTSSSARTLETLELTGFDAPRMVSRELYLAPAMVMLSHLRKAQGNKVMMLGHNPGIADFAEFMAEASPAHDRFPDYPTCATTVYQFDIRTWADVEPGSGRVQKFVIPRELV